MRARRGSALPLALVVMLLFVILCGTVIGMAQMNVAYYSFFEHRGILEQATLTFAETLAESVKVNSEDWWPGGDPSPGSGECAPPAALGAFPMKFTYVISPDKDVYSLFVQGEYSPSQPNDAAWGVSVDISRTSSADVWSEIVRK
jgi:hypothetical protein